MSLNHRFLLLNGPARSGKDTMARIIGQRFANVFNAKLAWPLRKYLMSVVPQADDTEWFEANKDSYIYKPTGETPREIMINHYTRVAESLGEGWLVDELMTRVSRFSSRIIIVTDTGRQVEADRISEAVGESGVKVMRLHRDGYDFKDNRAYINHPFAYDVQNPEGYVNGCADKIIELAGDWFFD